MKNSFDIVAKTATMSNVASTLLLVWTGFYSAAENSGLPAIEYHCRYTVILSGLSTVVVGWLRKQLDVHCYSSGGHLAEWVPYVLSARCAAEQNMEATLDDGLLYFSVTRDVDGGSQLLIWYSDQLARLLGVPELDDECRIGR